MNELRVVWIWSKRLELRRTGASGGASGTTAMLLHDTITARARCLRGAACTHHRSRVPHAEFIVERSRHSLIDLLLRCHSSSSNNRQESSRSCIQRMSSMNVHEEHCAVASIALSTSDNALAVELRTSMRPSSSSTSEIDAGDAAIGDEEKKRMRTRTANLLAVHRYRKRTKTETAELREEAVQLEAQVEQLRERVSIREAARGLHVRTGRSDALRLQASTPAVEDAATELRKLQQARSLNRRMKETLRKQRKDIATLERFLKTQVAKQVRPGVHLIDRSSWRSRAAC